MKTMTMLEAAHWLLEQVEGMGMAIDSPIKESELEPVRAAIGKYERGIALGRLLDVKKQGEDWSDDEQALWNEFSMCEGPWTKRKLIL